MKAKSMVIPIRISDKDLMNSIASYAKENAIGISTAIRQLTAKQIAAEKIRH